MTEHVIHIEGVPTPFSCDEAQTVLSAMRSADRSDIAFKCRAGGCGTCRVRVLSGHYATGPMSPEVTEAEELARHIVLACQLHPRSDLVVMPWRRSIEGALEAAGHQPSASTATFVGPATDPACRRR